MIPLSFSFADGFREGLAPARKGEESGFIDHDGHWAVNAEFDVTWGFHEGFALPRSKGAMRYVDRDGKVLATPLVDDHEAKSFSEGLAAVRIGRNWGYIDKAGNAIWAPTR